MIQKKYTTEWRKKRARREMWERIKTAMLALAIIAVGAMYLNLFYPGQPEEAITTRGYIRVENREVAGR